MEFNNVDLDSPADIERAVHPLAVECEMLENPVECANFTAPASGTSLEMKEKRQSAAEENENAAATAVVTVTAATVDKPRRLSLANVEEIMQEMAEYSLLDEDVEFIRANLMREAMRSDPKQNENAAAAAAATATVAVEGKAETDRVVVRALTDSLDDQLLMEYLRQSSFRGHKELATSQET